ncbi:LacI family DNA-binding transcriptional regulator [Dactylosporangium sp. NPDC005555]|uniref:LacI family DNA-binding transcriptional regulator n=1 Tax=Dactylosporangium sp. NPDC005555 TaxID=3154889 RepID=UPI0033A58149
MTTGRVTLLDVARRAGVSRTTASFVLTGRRDMRISADAEQRVRRAARELDYRPNLTARSLRTSVTQTIGLVSDTIATDAFAGEIIRGSTATALTRQHLIFIGETEGDQATEKRLVQDMLDRGVDGFLYAAMYTREIRIPAALRGHPVVLVNCLTAGRRAVAVVPDEFAAGRSAAMALLSAGHRDGIHIVGESAAHVHAARLRRDGIDEALAAAGARVAGTVEASWWPEPAYEAVRGFLAAGPRATALICLNDRLALGAYQAVAAAGLRIPEDLSVVAFDDSDLASWLRPQLTSVALPHFELGRLAVELLLDPDRTGGVRLVDMPLRPRSSIAPPRP